MLADTASDLLRRLAALADGSLRELAAVRCLTQLGPEQAAELIEHALHRLRQGDPQEATASGSILQAVLPELGLSNELRGEIYAAARSRSLLAATLFLSPSPFREPPRNAPSMEGTLSLGHRRAMARTAPPERFAKLGAEHDARVTRELLLNPRLTEAEVLRLASRRPAQPDVLLAIAHSPRFANRLSVRTALARNPYAPTRLAFRLLPHLPDIVLRDIGEDGTLHPQVRAFAGALVEVGGGDRS